MTGRDLVPQIVRVLIVDDSAYVRKVVAQMLSRSPSIEVVGTARDGADALEMVEELRPDVVTCDLNMPVLDGIGFVAAQMAGVRCRSSSSASPPVPVRRCLRRSMPARLISCRSRRHSRPRS